MKLFGPSSRQDMDLIEILEDDHKKLKSILHELEETEDRAKKKRTEGFRRLAEVLVPHSKAEAAVLYRRIQKKKLTHDITLEGYEEHAVADFLFAKLKKLPVTHSTWKAKITVLRESLEHHIKEEEHEMFKKVRALFTEDELLKMKNEFEKKRKMILARL